MFSWEIQQKLESNNWDIDSTTYIDICHTSPQIEKVKYNSYENCFEAWSNDGYYWKFTVHRKEI